MRQSRQSLGEQPDIHARLMSLYPEGNEFGSVYVSDSSLLVASLHTVPDWWYLVLFVGMFAMSIICMEVWPTHMPVWALVVALLIGNVSR